MENKSLYNQNLPVSRSMPPAKATPGPTTVRHIQPQASSFGVREVLSIGFRHKFLILTMFLIALIASPIVYYLLPRVYESTAYLMVKFGWEYIYSPELAMDGQSASPFARNEVLNSEIQILNSRDLKERVIASLGAQKIYPELSNKAKSGSSLDNLALMQFEKNFSVTPVKSSSVIEISFRNSNPQVTAEVLDKLVYYYSAKRLEVFKDPKSILFLEKKAAEYLENLRKTENDIEAYKQQNQVYSHSEQLTLLLGQQAGLENSLMANNNSLKELQQKLTSLQNQIKTIQESVPAPESLVRNGVSPNAQLLALQMKEQELLGKYKEDNRLVLDVRNQIEVLKKFLKDPKNAGEASPGLQPNPVYLETQKEIIKTTAELSALGVTNNSIKSQLQEINQRIQVFDLSEKKLRELERERANDEKNYQIALKKLEEARVFDDMDRQKMTSVSLIQPATVPLKPSKPSQKLPVFLLMGAALGLGGGAGLAYLLEMLQPSMTTPQDAEKHLSLPVLASIPFKKA